MILDPWLLAGLFFGGFDGYFWGLGISSPTRISGLVKFGYVLERASVFPVPGVHHEGAGFIRRGFCFLLALSRVSNRTVILPV